MPDEMETNQATNLRTTRLTCPCGKICKNMRGLKIHQTKMRCQVQSNQQQRAGIFPGETQGREAHHSAQSLQAEVQVGPDTPFRRKIKWPPASNKHAWHEFDVDISEILKITSRGSVDKRLTTMSKIIISYAAGKFGYEERKEKKGISKENRRELKIKQFRSELKTLRKQYKIAKPEERQPLRELRDLIRLKMKSLRRAEWHRRRRKERAKKRMAFLSNPFNFTKNLLGEN